ncbi:MAG: hypothetical protein C5B49_02570 [Bdellovibrio sp.]|nr:MAG: hypothetical protein C5B49_02570 [Bdellovibrio sp.]
MKLEVSARPGLPRACIECGGRLHAKSEHYCGKICASQRAETLGANSPPFLSKWKLRKRKLLNDPHAKLRSRTRNRTRELIRRGSLKRRPCIVCGERRVIAHHEDYLDPFKVIWMCEPHHKDYHAGKIALFNGRLKWDPARLYPKLPPKFTIKPAGKGRGSH